MFKQLLSIVVPLWLAASAAAPALAIDNPLVVNLHDAKGAAAAGSATIFGSGPTVLVNVTAKGNLPKGAAITLNDGPCSKPGDIAFALTALSENNSLTTLSHPLTDIAGKAKSLVIHANANQESPAAACGRVAG